MRVYLHVDCILWHLSSALFICPHIHSHTYFDASPPRRFLFDGQILRETETPLEKEMEDDDVIDAWLQQIGGGE
jgi:hypothetical protein